jgi:hypothetical protein
MIELTESTYIVGFWFASDPRTGNDWMACVIAHPEKKNHYKGWYRFRYRKDDRIFDNEDEKKWATFESKEEQTEKEVILNIDMAMEGISVRYKDVDKLMVQGNLDKFIKLSDTKKWLNLKVVSPGGNA